MTARELFTAIAPLVSPALEEIWHRRDLCILATRVAIETAAHFGIKATPMPVRVMAYNARFAQHVEEGVPPGTCAEWGDGSWAVGIGLGKPNAPDRWDGHLIAVADGCFADCSIQQAERPQYNIWTGPALVGLWDGMARWKAVNDSGTVVQYERIFDDFWKKAPDWRDAKRRRPVVGALVRAVYAMEMTTR
ncbi:MAG TPA: hypothetical protein VGG62_12250 [Terracidiphilus sp.]